MMDQIPENGTVQDGGSAPIPAAPLGKTLREAREHLGLSIADVAGQIKFASRQIEALEAEDFRHLPEMPFVRGFVRSYARILQLDAQPLLASLPQLNADRVQLVPASVEAPFPGPRSPQRQNLILLGAALLLSVLVVAFAVWHFTMPPEKSEAARIETPVSLPDRMQVIPASSVAEADVIVPPAAKTTRPPAEAAQPPAAKAATLPIASPIQAGAPTQAATLRLAFGEESWTEIRDGDDKVLSSQVNPRGSELLLNGKAPFSLVIGRAASARLHYRGKQVDLTPYINSSSEVARLTLE